MRLRHPLIQHRRIIALGILHPQPFHLDPTHIGNQILQLLASRKSIQQHDLINFFALGMGTLGHVQMHVSDDFLTLLCY